MKFLKNIVVQGSEGRWMGTDVFYPESKTHLPIVIYVHGFNGFKDWGNFDLIATQFANAGFFFIKMNLSHNGTTLETPADFSDLEAFGCDNFTRALFDVQQIIDWICNDQNEYKSFIDINRIALIGHSRGGGISILSAFEDKRIKALVTWASISECKTPWGNMAPNKLAAWKTKGVMYYSNKRTQQEMPLYYQLYEDYILNEKRFDLEKAIKNILVPILICHGTKDPAVSFNSAFALKNWQPNALLFSVESDHVFGRSHPWLEPNLPEAMQTVLNETILFLYKHFE